MTAPAFKMFGMEIATAAYQRLLANAEARALFGERQLRDRLARPAELAGIMYPVALHIDTLEDADEFLDQLAKRHVAEGLTPAHYPFLADALLAAIRDVLGEGASDRVLDGWHEGFWFLAELMMEREAELYRKAIIPNRAS